MGEPDALAAAQHLGPARLDQRSRGVLLAAPVRERDRAAQGEMTASRLQHGGRLRRERRGHRDPAGEEVDEDPVVEGDWQQRKRAGLARELDLPCGQLVPRLVVSQRPGDVKGQPQPAELLVLRELRVPKRAKRHLQLRRSGRVALAGETGQPVEQQTTSPRRLS
jgi:hypothetical protein